MAFVPGWDFNAYQVAHGQMVGSGRYCNLAVAAAPLPQAMSLSKYRTRYLQQGQAGTCHEHSPAQMWSFMAKIKGYAEFPACRRLIGWEGESLISGGNQANGGSPTANIMGMTAPNAGVAHESLCPYTDNATILGQKPPANVWTDARAYSLVSPVHVAPTFQAIATSIVGLMPVCNGYPCPSSVEAGQTFVSSGTKILGGHSELIVGFAQPGIFDSRYWLQFENWWGLMYPPLTPVQAIKVPGYMPVNTTHTSDCWIEMQYYLWLCSQWGQNGAEHVSATDLAGLQKGNVTPAPGTDPAIFVV